MPKGVLLRRPPIILWLYVAGDLWKLVLLTTAVLATVIAFALAIKPLADGKLGPADALRFMSLAWVPALQYVLPFAACFGATLAYHRMATDNELTACHAAGVGHRTMLVPAAVSGVILGLVLLVLSNYAIPRFFRSMAELVGQDVTRILISSIERGEAVRIADDMYIYADKVVPLGPDPESPGVYQRLYLQGLLVVRMEKDGAVGAQASARTAHVWLRRSGGGADEKPMTQVILKPNDFVGVLPGARTMGSDAVTRFDVPDSFSDNVKFLSFAELIELRQRPERIDSVERLRRSLGVSLGQREMVDLVREQLRSDGSAQFIDPFDQPVVLRAGDLRPTRRDGKREPKLFSIVPAQRGGAVVVERTPTDGARTQRQSAQAAYLRLPQSIDPARPGVRCTIQLLDVAAEEFSASSATTPDADAEVAAPQEDENGTFIGGRGEVKERPIADLRAQTDVLGPIMGLSTAELLGRVRERVARRPGEGEALAVPADRLRARVDDLMREVVSKEHERYAMSVACLVMVLVGAVMAMRLRDALPLTVYLWAFFPALFTMVAISGGQQLAHGKGIMGLPVLWSGVGVLTVLLLVEFRKLARH